MSTDIDQILTKYNIECSSVNRNKLIENLKDRVKDYKKRDKEKYIKMISFNEAIHLADYYLIPFMSNSKHSIQSFNNTILTKLNDSNKQLLRDFLQENNVWILIKKQHSEIKEDIKQKIYYQNPTLVTKSLSDNIITRLLAINQLNHLIKTTFNEKIRKIKKDITDVRYVVLDKPVEEFKTATYEDLCKLILSNQVNCTYCNDEMILLIKGDNDDKNLLLSFDAIIPIHGHTKDNLAICCCQCNSGKGTSNTYTPSYSSKPNEYQCLEVNKKEYKYILQNDLSHIESYETYRLELIKIADKLHWYDHSEKKLYSCTSNDSGDFIKDYILDGTEYHQKNHIENGLTWIKLSDVENNINSYMNYEYITGDVNYFINYFPENA